MNWGYCFCAKYVRDVYGPFFSGPLSKGRMEVGDGLLRFGGPVAGHFDKTFLI